MPDRDLAGYWEDVAIDALIWAQSEDVHMDDLWTRASGRVRDLARYYRRRQAHRQDRVSLDELLDGPNAPPSALTSRPHQETAVFAKQMLALVDKLPETHRSLIMGLADGASLADMAIERRAKMASMLLELQEARRWVLVGQKYRSR